MEKLLMSHDQILWAVAVPVYVAFTWLCRKSCRISSRPRQYRLEYLKNRLLMLMEGEVADPDEAFKALRRDATAAGFTESDLGIASYEWLITELLHTQDALIASLDDKDAKLRRRAIDTKHRIGNLLYDLTYEKQAFSSHTGSQAAH